MIKCILIDDEPLAIKVLEAHLTQVSEVCIEATFQNPIEAFEYLKSHQIDLIFLDIEMPLLSGIDFVKTVNSSTKVIFTTAHRNYAVESYELNVIDYLLKPISFSRLFSSIQKLKSHQKPNLENTNSSAEKETENYIYVNENKKYIKIDFDAILYIESLKDYVKIHLESKRVVTKDSISNFIKKLPNQFLRTHRSYIVNSRKITAFTSLDIEIDTIEIPIGASYKENILHYLKNNS
jgi:DNA-binding LytR/AlgR family response regulator